MILTDGVVTVWREVFAFCFLVLLSLALGWAAWLTLASLVLKYIERMWW